MTDPNPPDFVKALAQAANQKGADAEIICDHCGWKGTWRTCEWSDEGSFEEGYWRSAHCPNGCDDDLGDYTLYEVAPDSPTDGKIID